MTTIIADKKTLAMYSDSRCSWGTMSFKTQKIHRIGNSLWGTTGDFNNALKFLDWVRSGAKDDGPSFNSEDFCVVELCADGLFIWDESLTRQVVLEEFLALGSGASYAVGAMEMGATPEQAIEIASRGDPATALPLDKQYLRARKKS